MSNHDTIACPSVEAPYLERVNFFPRQLITADDMIQEQRYFRDKLRRHNRLLHGWGIVCGACVKPGAAWEVIVEPGYVLGPYGDEIVIDQELTVNLSPQAPDCAVGPDPWCTSPLENNQPQRLYIAVRYVACHARPVRVHTAVCGCDEASCEFSRIRDSFEIRALTELPSSYDPMPTLSPTLCGDCPACPDDPWVLLAWVELGDNGIADVHCDAIRRYVRSNAAFYYSCIRQRVTPTPTHAEIILNATTETEPYMLSSLNMRDVNDHIVSVTFPVHFEIREGDTYASWLAREGDIAYRDPLSNETCTLRELFALTRVDPETVIETAEEALAPLEGASLRVADLRRVKSRLAELLDSRGMERLEEEHAGSPAAVEELPLISIKGLSSRSILGRHLSEFKISDVAGMTQGEFTKKAMENVEARDRQKVERQAKQVWFTVVRLAGLCRAWRKQ